MIIPDSCLPWLKLQRSGYTDHRTEYKIAIEREFHIMREYLPTTCNTVLDIGCGIAGIDVFLNQFYKDTYFYLLDNSGTSKKPIYGYNRGSSFYNSFQATIEMMQINGVKNFQILDVASQVPEPLLNIKPHLIISLLSWGYHYPVIEYIKQVAEIIHPEGVLIMDTRINQGGMEEVRKYFPNIEIIITENKSNRICAWL